MTKATQLSCRCGGVKLEVHGAPIIRAECHCTSCRTAGARLQAFCATPILEDNGGTRCELYRKDRIVFASGADLLKEFRLTPKSPTRRVVAGCCNTPLFLEFQSGHWLSVYRGLWPEGTLPPPELRTMTSDLPEGVVLPSDIHNAKTQSLSFFAKLLGAWIAMGFRVPKIPVAGEIRA